MRVDHAVARTVVALVTPVCVLALTACGSGPSRAAARAHLGRIWTYQVTGEPRYATTDAGRVFVAGDRGTVTALDATTGRPAWIKQVAPDDRFAVGAAGGSVFVTDPVRGITAYDAATGRARWTAPTRRSVQGSTDTPAVARGVYAFAGGDGLTGLDVATGRRLWHVAPGLVAATAADGQRLYVRTDRIGGGATAVRALDPRTGAVQWSAAVPVPNRTYALTYLAAMNGLLLVLAVDDSGMDAKPATLFAFAAATGRPRWHTPIADAAHAGPPVVAGDVVALPTAHGVLGFAAGTGAARFARKLDFDGTATGIAACGRFVCALGQWALDLIDRRGRAVSTAPAGEDHSVHLVHSLDGSAIVYGLDSVQRYR